MIKIEKSHKILIIFGLILAMVIFYISRPLGSGNRGKVSFTVAELQARVQKLETELNGMVQLKAPSDLTLKKEREKTGLLEKRLKQSASEKESLGRELSQAKRDMELTGSIRKKLGSIEKSLDPRRLGAAGEAQIRKQLKSVQDKLDGLDSALLPLAKKVSVPPLKTQAARQGADDELTKKLALAEKAKSSLEEKVRDLEKTVADLQKNNADLARRDGERSPLAQKLAESEKTVAGLKDANRSLSEGLKTLEKDLNDIDSKQALLIKEKKDALREKLEAVKDAGVLKDKLISLDAGNESLSRQMQSLKAELSNLQAASEKLGAEKETIRKDLAEAKAAGANAQSLKEEIARLQSQLKQLAGDYAALKEEYAKASQEFQQNKAVSGERADTILTMQDKLAKAESALSGIQARIQSAEKDSALLRQDFVAMQIDREELKRQLSLAKIKFSDAQSKLRQIGTLFSVVPEDGVQPAEGAVQPAEQELKKESVAQAAASPAEKPALEGAGEQPGTVVPAGIVELPAEEQTLPAFPGAPAQEPPADSPGQAAKKPGKKVNVELAPQSVPPGAEVK